MVLTSSNNLAFSQEAYNSFVAEYLAQCGSKAPPDPRTFIIERCLCAVHKPTMSVAVRGEVQPPTTVTITTNYFATLLLTTAPPAATLLMTTSSTRCTSHYRNNYDYDYDYDDD